MSYSAYKSFINLKIKKSITHSFFPTVDSQLVVWTTNYKIKITANAVALSLTPDQVTKEISFCDDLIASINEVNNSKKTLKSSLDAKMLTVEKQGGFLRAEIARHKLALDYTDAIGQDLGIIGTTTPFDVNTYKAKITAETFAGYARIKFTKRGADGINIYHRLKGKTEWQFMSRVTKSPFDDHIVLENPPQPEHWEYRVFGVMNDLENGVASDIIEIIIGS